MTDGEGPAGEEWRGRGPAVAAGEDGRGREAGEGEGEEDEVVI